MVNHYILPKKTSKYLEMELKDFLGVVEESTRAKNGGNKGRNSETNHQRETSYHCTHKLIIIIMF